MGGLVESVVALIEAGVPVDAMGAGGNTALHLAADHKQDGVVAVLVRAGETLCVLIRAGNCRVVGDDDESVSAGSTGSSHLERWDRCLVSY